MTDRGQFTKDHGIARITINTPPSTPCESRRPEAFQKCWIRLPGRQRPKPWSGIGGGRTFVAGADLKIRQDASGKPRGSGFFRCF